MKRMSWYVVGFMVLSIGLGLGISILLAYVKAYVFGGIEEETLAIFVMISLMVFVPAGIIIGKLVERRMG